jgi:hypothetical protein
MEPYTEETEELKKLKKKKGLRADRDSCLEHV